MRISSIAWTAVLTIGWSLGICEAAIISDISVSVVENGKPAASIVVAQETTPAAQLAALELQFHIHKITGAVLPVVTDDEETAGTRILVGDSRRMRDEGITSDNFGPQEYLIGFRPDTIILLGRDWHDTEKNRAELGSCTYGHSLASHRHQIDYHKATGHLSEESSPITLPGLFDDQGTCYATYDFLERFCGVRWYGPSELNIVVPSQNSLAVQGHDIQRSPDLMHRHAMGGSWPIVRVQWDEPNDDQLKLFWRRLRMGGEKWAGNHTIWRNTVKEIFNDPEYQAIGSGRGSQLCLTHPKLIQDVTQSARDFFDGRSLPNGLKAMGDYFAVVPDDNASWCECRRCRDVLAVSRQDERGKGFFSNARDSYYVFHFVNEVAKQVRTTHPRKFIVALAYASYAYRPKDLQLEPNVSVAPCLHTCYGYDRGTSENDTDVYRSWVVEDDRRIHLWNYFHHPMEPAVMQKWNCFPCFMPDVISRDVRRFHRDGVRGVFLCGIGQQLDYYLYMQTALNVNRDHRELIDEFFALYFGQAGEPMKKFYYRIAQINQEEGVVGTSPQSSWGKLGTEQRMNELEAYMRQAASLAHSNLEKRRVESWQEGVWDYMQSGRHEFLKQAK